MSRLPKTDIGVVIVNYNSGHCLEQCVRSLVNSSTPLKIVIVDNDSVDDSLKKIREVKTASHQLKMVENDENHGFSKAVNQGALLLDTKYIMLLNPDSTVFPGTLSALKNVLASKSQIAIAGAVVFNRDGSEQRGCRRNEPTLKRSIITSLGLGRSFEGIDKTYQPFPSQPEQVDAVSGAAMMIVREYFDQVSGMDEDYFLHCEDLDICRRMRDNGYLVMFCPNASVIHGQGASSGKSFSEVEKFKHQGMLIYNAKHFGGTSNKFNQAMISLLVKSHFLSNTAINSLKSRLNRSDPTSSVANPVENQFSTLMLTQNLKPLVLITGGKSDVGDFLLRHLENSKYQCIAVIRSSQPRRSANKNVLWVNLEFFSKLSGAEFDQVEVWINLAPVWTTRVLAKILHKFRPKKIIGLSSTSIDGKADSPGKKDIEIVEKLVSGEEWTENYANKYQVDTSIIRPTLIYGGPRNQNINFIKKVIRYCRIFPLVGDGRGRRQPVHAEDVAIACKLLLGKNKKSFDVYNIAGDEVLSYRDMVGKTFHKLGIKERFITVPVSLVATAIKLINWIPGLDFLSPEMAQRMQQDLVYPNDNAKATFSFTPRKFKP